MILIAANHALPFMPPKRRTSAVPQLPLFVQFLFQKIRPNPGPPVLAVNPRLCPLVYGSDGDTKVLGRYFGRHLFGPVFAGWLHTDSTGYNVGNLCGKLLYLVGCKCYLSGHSSKVSFAAQQIAPAKARRRAKMKAIVPIIHIRQFVLSLIRLPAQP